MSAMQEVPLGWKYAYAVKTDDNTSGPQQTLGGDFYPVPYSTLPLTFGDWYSSWNKPSVTPKEGVEMQGLFEVYLVYGESRKEPIIHSARVVATSEEEAKLKSGLYPLIQKDWDPDYVTLFGRKLGDVAVKERAKEVKQV